MTEKKTKIPAGYRLTIVSWENDVDNYNTVIVDGLTKEQAAFLTDFCKQMGSQSSSEPEMFGNMYEPSDEEIEEYAKFIIKLAEKHGYESMLEQLPIGDEEGYVDYSSIADSAFYAMSGHKIYNLGLAGGDFFTRVCESFKVEFIPQPIELQDVTEEFK